MKRPFIVGLVCLCVLVLGASVTLADRPLCVGDPGACFISLGGPQVSLGDDSGNLIWSVGFPGNVNDFVRVQPDGESWFFHAVGEDVPYIYYCPVGVIGPDCWEPATGPGPGSFVGFEDGESLGHATFNIDFPSGCPAQASVKGEVQKTSTGAWFEIKIHFVATDDASGADGCRNIVDKVELKPMNN